MACNEIKHDCDYDEKADVLYIHFGDDEPTLTEDIDNNELVLLEIGCFSGLPKGFRIIGPRKHNIHKMQFQVIVRQVIKQLKSIVDKKIEDIQHQEQGVAQVVKDDIFQALQQVH